METITKTCRHCGDEFYLTPTHQKRFAEKDMTLPTRCICCRAKNRHIEDKICKDCGVLFQISELELEWYKKAGLSEPVRCGSCRAKRRMKVSKSVEEVG